jgi:hypothetical protein
MTGSRVAFGSVFFDRKGTSFAKEVATPSPDSVWRVLKRREKGIEKEFQELLDMQAAGLVSGGAEQSDTTSQSERDVFSDTGSSTPTGTFYSTATSRSRMLASIEQPTRSTARGDVIPVRQPRRAQPQGIRAARNGLRKSMARLADLKAEENAHVTLAVSQRKQALSQLRHLASRQNNIKGELRALEEDEQEPLGKELRDLEGEHGTLSAEIQELEERLVGMRNRRRWLEGKMDDVRNRRDAGLSGYRGALKEVESEVAIMMRRPSIKPLDIQALRSRSGSVPGEMNENQPSPGGAEFLRLIPERRTVEMAKQWWEGEIAILEARKAAVDKEREALEKGAEVWAETIKIVSDFESDLRKLMRGDVSPNGMANGKAAATPTHEEVVGMQLPRMAAVITELEERLRVAEENHWNLLICAIGAELEAFKEAEHVLHETLRTDDDSIHPKAQKQRNGSLVDLEPDADTDADTDAEGEKVSEEPREESDNEVPADLLVSHFEDHDGHDHRGGARPPMLLRIDSGASENDVPPEFLREQSDQSID